MQRSKRNKIMGDRNVIRALLINKLVPHLHAHALPAGEVRTYCGLVDAALDAIGSWSEKDRALFVSGHPRIGEKDKEAMSALSRKEQQARAVPDGMTSSLATPPEKSSPKMEGERNVVTTSVWVWKVFVSKSRLTRKCNAARLCTAAGQTALDALRVPRCPLFDLPLDGLGHMLTWLYCRSAHRALQTMSPLSRNKVYRLECL